MDKKLLKIILVEAIVGLVSFFWYKNYISEDASWSSGIGLVLIFIITVATMVITFILAFIMKLLDRNPSLPGAPSNRYGLKFWIILIICIAAFIVAIPYIVMLIDKARYSAERINCVQVITPAKHLKSGEIRDFPTPCDVPAGWQKI